jgi:hypothetical protein
MAREKQNREESRGRVAKPLFYRSSLTTSQSGAVASTQADNSLSGVDGAEWLLIEKRGRGVNKRGQSMSSGWSLHLFF